MINYLQQFSLNGKVAFVTGGAGLIGAEITKAFASAGAQTVILDINVRKAARLCKELKQNGYQADFIRFNIAQIENAQRNLDQLVKKFKRVDIWVNSAYPRTKSWGVPLEQMTLKDWRENVDGQMNAYLWLSRLVALQMRKQEIKGSIVNLSSIYGVQANDFTIYEGTSISPPMAYTAIKAGIMNASRYLASYFGKNGIRVNTICPGGIQDGQAPQFIRNYINKVPLKRMATVNDIASAALYLASDAASYVTGATLMVDGGWTIV